MVCFAGTFLESFRTCMFEENSILLLKVWKNMKSFFSSWKHTSNNIVLDQVGGGKDLMYCLLEGLISGGIHNFMASSVCFCHGLYIYICFIFL